MIQLLQFSLIVLLGIVTLRIAYLLGKSAASDEVSRLYSEYTRMANRLAASEKDSRHD